MTNTTQHLLPLSWKSRFYLDSEDEKENSPPLVLSKSLKTMSSLNTDPLSSSKPLEEEPPTSPSMIPCQITSHTAASIAPVLSLIQPGTQYEHGKYFGIPVGQLAESRKLVSSGSGHLIADTEHAKQPVPAPTVDKNETPAVDMVSHWSSSSESEISVQNKLNSYQPEAVANLPGPSRRARTTRGSPMRERFAPENMEQSNQGSNFKNADDIPKDRTRYCYRYPEFPPTAKVVIRGGFEHIPKAENKSPRMPIGEFFRKFPPPSNKDYEYTSDARDPKFVYQPSTPVLSHNSAAESSTTVVGTVVQQQVVRPKARNAIAGDSLRDKDQAECHDKSIRLLGLGLGESATDEEREFISKEAYSLLEQRSSHCWRCDCIHIEFGPPETLPDRDTCGAYLPSWFPAHQYQYPWREFRELWRDIVYLEETGRNVEFIVPGVNRQQPLWDREYHIADPKWTDLHPELHGWWKCRNGSDATDVEKSCVVCHTTKTSVDKDPRLEQYLIKKDAIVKWVYHCLKHMGVDDKAAAESIVLRLGINRISHYPCFPGNGDKGQESRFMPESPRLNMLESDKDGDTKGKAPESFGSVKYPSALQPRERDPYPVKDAHPYRYLSGSRQPNPRFDVRNLWNEDDSSNTPVELKTYATLMQDNYDPRVDDDEKARDENERKMLQDDQEKRSQKTTRVTINQTVTNPTSTLSFESTQIVSSRAPNSEMEVAAPTPDRTKARSGTVSDLEAVASEMGNMMLITTPTRMTRLN